jgi:type I site-specific restriction endonuclease
MLFDPRVSPAMLVCFDDESQDTPPDLAGAPKTFTQEELNKILAEDKRQHQARYTKVEAQYQTLLKNQSLTDEERGKLTESLEDVRRQLQSKEQIQKTELKQLEDRLTKELTEVKTAKEAAEKRYTDMVVHRSLKDAAHDGDAFNADQVVTLLKPYVKLVEGEKTMIDFPDRNADTGESIVTQMTPVDAIKRMKQLPETWGNLFKANVVSGIGGASAIGGFTPGSSGRIDLKSLTMDQYLELRAKNPKALGL